VTTSWTSTPLSFGRSLDEVRTRGDEEALIWVPTVSPAVVADLAVVDRRLTVHLARHPEDLHRLEPRRFEELVARMFEDLGYEVELTLQTRDGGRDIRAIRKDEAGPVLYLVECKKHRPDRLVGVGLVRQLYGVKQAERANVGVLVTTSGFTKDAREFTEHLGYELSLKDYDDLREWLRRYAEPQS
jgi:restriction system protein